MLYNSAPSQPSIQSRPGVGRTVPGEWTRALSLASCPQMFCRSVDCVTFKDRYFRLFTVTFSHYTQIPSNFLSMMLSVHWATIQGKQRQCPPISVLHRLWHSRINHSFPERNEACGFARGRCGGVFCGTMTHHKLESDPGSEPTFYYS